MILESQHPVGVKVWGALACFSRPELKVERVSYPIITPSAARGLLEAIVWKPEFQWRIEAIWLLNPIEYVSMVRLECKAFPNTARLMTGWPSINGSYNVDDSEHRDPRHMLALCNVAYIIWANVEVRQGVNVHPAKYRDQFRRRVASGACFHRPYLGLRECAAFFAPPAAHDEPQDYTADLGWMLHSLDFAQDGSNRGTPRFFPAQIEHGVLRVPPQAVLSER